LALVFVVAVIIFVFTFVYLSIFWFTWLLSDFVFFVFFVPCAFLVVFVLVVLVIVFEVLFAPRILVNGRVMGVARIEDHLRGHGIEASLLEVDGRGLQSVEEEAGRFGGRSGG
jgi:hypothetical protein